MKIVNTIIFGICFISVCNSFGQIGYQQDSLQIKVYTEIEYVNRQAQNIKVDTVFCDYCSVNQIQRLKEEARRRAYMESNNEKYRLINGKKKLALYIRISKKDFLEIREENSNSED